MFQIVFNNPSLIWRPIFEIAVDDADYIHFMEQSERESLDCFFGHNSNFSLRETFRSSIRNMTAGANTRGYFSDSKSSPLQISGVKWESEAPTFRTQTYTQLIR